MNAYTFGFIGGGRITYLLLKRLSDANSLPDEILVSDPNDEVLKKIRSISSHSIQTTSNNSLPGKADIVFLAVHPPVMGEVLNQIKKYENQNRVIVSLSPIVKISKIKEILGKTKNVVRMIPNAPSIIGKGYNPISFDENFPIDMKEYLMNLFENWGTCPEVPEEKLEAYAIISGMGPTYFWPQWLELHRLGRQFGLTNEDLNKAMPSMLKGAIESLYSSGLPEDEVTDLIPVYPLKPDEENIIKCFQKNLIGLFNKLTKQE
jgi:pyrroline-5-carboxylate reductase